MWLLVPYYLLDARGLPAALGGLLFAAHPGAWALATPLGGWLADRDEARWLAPAALGLAALGLLGVSRPRGGPHERGPCGAP
jgi:nitrate/nitrite transporter NarK